MLVVAFTEASRSEFLAAMERKVTKQVFDTWIKPLDINCDLEESILQISAPSPVARRWIVSNYSDAIQGALAEMNLNGVRVEWGVSQQTRPTKLPTPDESFAEGADGSAGEIESLSPEAKRSAAAPMSHQPRCSIPGSSSLNQKYVFPVLSSHPAIDFLMLRPRRWPRILDGVTTLFISMAVLG